MKEKEGGKSHKLNVRVKKNRAKPKTVEERIISQDEFIDGFEEKVDKYVDSYVEKVERTKMLTLFSGVSFFMLLIVFFYAYSFKAQIINVADSGSSEIKIDDSIDKIKNDINEAVKEYGELKESLSNEISNIETTTPVNTNQNVLPQTEEKGSDEIDSESIDTLKKKLLEEKNK